MSKTWTLLHHIRLTITSQACLRLQGCNTPHMRHGLDRCKPPEIKHPSGYDQTPAFHAHTKSYAFHEKIKWPKNPLFTGFLAIFYPLNCQRWDYIFNEFFCKSPFFYILFHKKMECSNLLEHSTFYNAYLITSINLSKAFMPSSVRL